MSDDRPAVAGTWGRFAPLRAYRELRRDFDRAVFVLAAGDLVASFGFALIFPFLTIYLTSRLGASAFEAGLVLALYSVFSVVSNAAGGWLADRFGRRRVMIGSITLTAVTVMAMGQARDLPTIGALTMLLGLVDPAFIPAARAAVADVVPEARRPRAYALLSVAASVGWIAGPAVGAGLSGLGYPFLFAAAGVVIGGYTLVLLFFMPETRPSDAAVAAAHRREAGIRAASPEAAHCGLECEARHVHRYAPEVEARLAVDRRKIFAAFTLLAILLHAGSFQWVVTLPLHAVADLGVTAQQWGLLFSLNGLLIIFFQLRISTFTERRSKPRIIGLGTGAYALGYVVVATIPGASVALPLLALTIVVVTIGEMLVFPLSPALVSDLSPMQARGRYQGVFGAAVGAGSAFGPPVGGYILDVAPGATLWLLTAGVLAAGAFALWLLGRWTDRLPAPADVEAGALPETARPL